MSEVRRMEDYTDRDEFYRDIARRYKEQSITRKPTKVIAQTFNVPHSTAARWVRVARHRGYIPPFHF